MRISVFLVLIVGVSSLLCEGARAQRGDKGGEEQKDPPASLKIPPAPALLPEEALKSFQIVDGFKIEIVASEPLIQDPVAMQFDGDGHIWVVEMQSFMPNAKGDGEDEPSSRIVVLADTDGDGRMDKSHVFMDGLVLPRALQFVPGGILYADQQKLYYVPILPGLKPGEQVVVDAKYSGGGNVEHKANGLLRGLDNWLYNAKSGTRYRFDKGKWIVENTEQRGQWGISQDDYGRLYYNGNSSNVYGDWVPAGAMMRNPNIKKKRWTGTNMGIVKSTRVFPIRVTTGVNRGYNNLDKDFKLKGLTAACGPLIYRGTQFPEEYYGNAFTPAPCCNVIKRNILTEKDAKVGGEQAYKDHEFLASTDERFRPVALSNGPDGALYVVDFYRGIIQHKTYVTSYLRRQIESRGLDKPTGLGRIYRIVSTAGSEKVTAETPQFSKMKPVEWVAYLAHSNAWWRETAQRLLVDRREKDVVPALEKMADKGNALGRLHALWTLEGLSAVTPTALAACAKSGDPKVRAHTVRVAESLGTPDAFAVVASIANSASTADEDLQLAFSLGRFPGEEPLKLLAGILKNRGGDDLFAEAAASGLKDREKEMLTLIQAGGADRSFEKISAMLAMPLEVAQAEVPALKLDKAEQALYDEGKNVFESFCIGCHGADGNGIITLAPPVSDSEWVVGSPARLAAIILNGVQGAITVAGERYKAPEIQPLMPGLRENPLFTDEQLAGVMSYVRNNFGNRAPIVLPDVVKHAREKYANKGILTETELKEIQ